MTDSERVNELLAQHKAALEEYRKWDEQVKQLLKARRAGDLSREEMETYREIVRQRDAAYDLMRRLEHALLNEDAGAETAD